MVGSVLSIACWYSGLSSLSELDQQKQKYAIMKVAQMFLVLVMCISSRWFVGFSLSCCETAKATNNRRLQLSKAMIVFLTDLSHPFFS